MSIGQKIRFLRKEKHLTQKQLAKNLCVTSQAISKWENGRNMPDVTILPSIARNFGISIDELFDYNASAC